MEVTKFHIEQRNYLSTNTKNADERFILFREYISQNYYKILYMIENNIVEGCFHSLP